MPRLVTCKKEHWFALSKRSQGSTADLHGSEKRRISCQC